MIILRTPVVNKCQRQNNGRIVAVDRLAGTDEETPLQAVCTILLPHFAEGGQDSQRQVNFSSEGITVSRKIHQ